MIPDKRLRRKENLAHLDEFIVDRPCYYLDPATAEWSKVTVVSAAPESIEVLYYENEEPIYKNLDLSEVLPCFDDKSDYSDEHEQKNKHKSKHKRRSRSRSRSRSSSSDSRRKRNKEGKHNRSRSNSREKRKEKKIRKTDMKDLEEEVRRIRMNQASSNTRAGYNIKASSYKTSLTLAMPVGIGKHKSRSPSPERKFVKIENLAADRKTEKILKVDETEFDRQNKQQNERLEKLKKNYIKTKYPTNIYSI